MNGPIHVNCNILKFVATSAAESETREFFVTERDVVIPCNTLEEIGHTQPITQVCTGNTTDTGIVNDTIKQHISLTMNMRYFGICDQKTLTNFLIAWKSVQENLAEYFTKTICKTS